ncbi:MAG: sigma 54-interacting transcriptional regulator [Polyangiales bacterium]
MEVALSGLRALALLGPLFVGYLVAAALDALAPVAAAHRWLALLTVALPVVTLMHWRRAAAAQLGWAMVLASAWAIWLVPQWCPRPHTPAVVAVAAQLASALLGALLLLLALDQPALRPGCIARTPRRVLHGVLVAAACATALSLFALVAPTSWQLALGLWPAWVTQLPLGVWATGVLLSWLLRLRLRSKRAQVHARTAEVWLIWATGPLLLWTAAQGVARLWQWPWMRLAGPAWALAAWCAVTLWLGGFAAMQQRRWARWALPAVQWSLSLLVTLLSLCGLGLLWWRLAPPTGVVDTVLCVSVVLGLAGGGLKFLHPHIGRLVDASGQRFARALAGVERALAATVDLDALAPALLLPLRRGVGDLRAAPVLYLLQPARKLSLDQAGTARLQTQPLPDVLAERVSCDGHRPILACEASAAAVREAHWRPCADYMQAHDIAAVLPLSHHGELEGVLLVPRGPGMPSLRELQLRLLSQLSAPLAATLYALGRHLRVQAAYTSLRIELGQMQGALDAANAALDAQGLALTWHQRGPQVAMPWVRYSPAMAGLDRALGALASHRLPVLVYAHMGSDVVQVAWRLHGQQGPAARPFLVIDCTALAAEQAEAALFAAGAEAPGALQVAAGGTVVLQHVAALPAAVQRRLADALAHGRSDGTDARDAFGVRAQIVLTLPRVPDGVGQQVLEPALASWVEARQLSLPTLPERREDMQALALLLIERSCRAQGHGALGLDNEALALLGAYAWPGDLRELTWTVDHAVARCQGPVITASDLPVWTTSSASLPPAGLPALAASS